MRRRIPIAALLLLACGRDGPVPDPGEGPGDSGGDTAEPPVLDPAHPGWREADCWACHLPDDHDRDLRPGDCTPCHGANGAPAGHGGDPPCADCHGAPHEPADRFPDPDSCEACHPPGR